MTEITDVSETDTPALDGDAVPAEQQEEASQPDLSYPQHDATTHDVNLRATALNFAHNPTEPPAQVIERADQYYAFLCGVTPAV